MQTQGYFDLAFKTVKDRFCALFDEPGRGVHTRGAALCVQVDGETVLDLWAGTADKDAQSAWQTDTVLNLFSCTKAFTAVAAMQLVQEGKLELDRPVQHYWPEFAAAGKGAITVRQLLCHQAGLPALHAPLPANALYEWDTMTAALAAETPWWVPGETHGYSPMTYGWLIGEIIRRIDGRSPGEAIVSRTAKPLDLDFYIGLPESEEYRVAHIARGKGDMGDAAAQRLLRATMTDPQALSTRAFANPPGILTSTNKPEWRRFEQPAANGHGNARSLAGFYTGLLNGRLLDQGLLQQMLKEHSRGDDRTLMTSTRFGLGFMLDQPEHVNATYGLGAQAFGHPGAGGSIGFADPERKVAFGFATNTLGPYILMDPRAQQLAEAVGQCL